MSIDRKWKMRQPQNAAIVKSFSNKIKEGRIREKIRPSKYIDSERIILNAYVTIILCNIKKCQIDCIIN